MQVIKDISSYDAIGTILAGCQNAGSISYLKGYSGVEQGWYPKHLSEKQGYQFLSLCVTIFGNETCQPVSFTCVHDCQ